MEAYQHRVVEEKTQLDDRISRLDPFVRSETFKGLPLVEQERLILQLRLMKEYSDVLSARIAAFSFSA